MTRPSKAREAFELDVVESGFHIVDCSDEVFVVLSQKETVRQQRPLSVTAAMGLVESHRTKEVRYSS